MTIYSWLILALWVIFVAFWVVSAASAKKTIGRRAWGREVGLRLIVVVFLLIALRVPAVNYALRHARADVLTTNAALGVSGAVLCALGIGLAIAARIYLGANWGLPMAQKEHPELVTTGPYSLVRHPIYSGLILALLGSAVAETVFWLLPLPFVCVYFAYSAYSEETLMSEQFPEQYPAYRKRTKMFVPFVL